jgi:tRNA pseudouridine55 synthase
MTDPNRPPPPSGLVLIDKSADRWMTSMKVVHRVKNRLRIGGVTDRFRKRGLRVGHAGTLDPLASGLLIVLVGKATELCDQLMAGEKTYRAAIDLAHHSTTDDLEGTLSPNPIMSPPAREAIEHILQSRFVGVIQQRPPAYSAIWVNAERAYDLARAGAPPELPERPIVIHAITIVDYAYPSLTIDVLCGKGTYIRSLARDIGLAATGFAGCLTALRRVTIGPYHVDDAMKVDDIPPKLTLADLRAV